MAVSPNAVDYGRKLVIDTREELIDALCEAAELEHGLLLQYLFAALSMKRRLDEHLTPSQQELVRLWEGHVLAVARSEMAHLGQVCNLLAAVGGAPRFGRPNFPQPAKEYYPFEFRLERFSDAALYRFIRFELPKGEKPPERPRPTMGLKMASAEFALIPDPLEYEYIGELYRQILEAFLHLPEDQLFIGPKSAQDTDDWSLRFRLFRVQDRASAQRAINFIVEEGEGSPQHREGSHYDTFLKTRKALAEELERDPTFDPARAVVLNPRTRPHPDAPYPSTLIENTDTRAVTELFNACYEIALLMLMQLYSFGGETMLEREALRNASRQMMSGVLRPMAEILTELAVADDVTQGTAGPSFELYTNLQLATQPASRWTLLFERYENVERETSMLRDLNPRLTLISENLGSLRINIQRAQERETRL
jgi:hypothetical protein